MSRKVLTDLGGDYEEGGGATNAGGRVGVGEKDGRVFELVFFLVGRRSSSAENPRSCGWS